MADSRLGRVEHPETFPFNFNLLASKANRQSADMPDLTTRHYAEAKVVGGDIHVKTDTFLTHWEHHELVECVRLYLTDLADGIEH
jgi:hypothetical protein